MVTQHASDVSGIPGLQGGEDVKDARCRDGVLELTTLGDLRRDLPSRMLLRMIGPENYHPVEYQLYYVSLRQDAVDRAAAWAP